MALAVIGLAPLFWYQGFKMGYHVRVPRELLMMSGAAALAGAVVMRHNLWLGFFVIVAALNAFTQSMENRIFFFQAYYALMAVVGGTAVYLWAVHASKKTVDFVIQAILCIAVSNAAYAFVQWLGYEPLEMYGGARDPGNRIPVVGFLDNPGILGIFLGFAAPLALMRGRWAIPFIVIGLALSKSILGVTGTLIACAWIGGRKLSLKQKMSAGTVLSVLLMVGLAFAVGNEQNERWSKIKGLSERARVVRSTIWLWPQHVDWHAKERLSLKTDLTSILTGWGIGSFSTRFIQYDFKLFNIGIRAYKREAPDKKTGITVEDPSGQKLNIVGEAWRQAHNEYVQVLFEFGLAGIIVVGLFLWSFVKRLKQLSYDKAAYAGAVIVILIVALGHFPLHLASISAPFMAVLGFLDAKEG